MKKCLKLLILGGLVMLQACSSLPSQNSLTSVVGVENMSQAVADLQNPQKQDEFSDAMRRVADEVSKDPSYERIPLDSSEEMEWFTARAFLLWDGQLSKQDFIALGTQRFPNLRVSFEKVASILV